MSLPEHTIVREKGMGREYDESRLGATHIMNFPEWRSWGRKYYGGGLTKRDFELGCRLTGDNRLKLRAILGKPSFHFSGSHYFHCWYVRLPHADFIILTSKDHGTCYEVVTKRGGTTIPHDIQEVLGFMGELAEELPPRLNIDTMEPI